jgi:sugar O-acyltransferase (sialic acid O-acetyltransferase NeuD family)
MIRAGRDFVFADETELPNIWGRSVLRPCEIRPDDDELCIAIGNSPVRRELAERLKGHSVANVIAPTAIIGEDVEIGEGAVFCDHTMVTASARIGRQFQCNIYSYVAHDCVIGDYVTFGPRVCCNGNVHIGDGAHIASGANIRNGTPDKPLLIGAGAFVGMGAVVTKDVPPGITVIGNPARVMGPKFELAVNG